MQLAGHHGVSSQVTQKIRKVTMGDENIRVLFISEISNQYLALWLSLSGIPTADGARSMREKIMLSS